MLGAVLKRYFAPNVMGIDPRRVRVVSVMPCVKKQAEADRAAERERDGLRDVDHVITTMELAEVLKKRGIVDLASLPVSPYDDPLSAREKSSASPSPPSSQSGSGVLFGTSGGVMEAALRTVYEAVTGERLARLEFEECRVRAECFPSSSFFLDFFGFVFSRSSSPPKKTLSQRSPSPSPTKNKRVVAKQQGLEGVKEATVHMRVPKGSPLLGGGGEGRGPGPGLVRGLEELFFL